MGPQQSCTSGVVGCLWVPDLIGLTCATVLVYRAQRMKGIGAMKFGSRSKVLTEEMWHEMG